MLEMTQMACEVGSHRFIAILAFFLSYRVNGEHVRFGNIQFLLDPIVVLQTRRRSLVSTRFH